MLIAHLERLVRCAEIDSGGRELMIHVGELVAQQLRDELGHLPETISEHRLNPYFHNTPGPDEVVIESRPYKAGPQGGDWCDEYVRERIDVGLTSHELEAYLVLRQDRMPVELAREVAKALEHD